MTVAVKLRKPDPVWEPYIGRLKEAAEVLLLYDGELKDVYNGVDILITTNADIGILDKFPELRAIFAFKTGLDNMPLEELENRGIYIRGSHANSSVIAEHAVALSLALLHRIPELHGDLKNGLWNRSRWRSLSELNVGILGYGHIGRSIREKLKGFGCQVLGYNRSRSYAEDIELAGSVGELIERSDIIYLCLPKTAETAGMLDRSLLEGMKGKYLINVGRAEVCREEALYALLKDGTIAGYASDVWYREADKKDPCKAVMPSEYPFWQLDNVVMSPHCATHEANAHEAYISDTVNACIKYIGDTCL